MELTQKLLVTSIGLFVIWLGIRYFISEFIIEYYASDLLGDGKIKTSNDIRIFLSDKVKSGNRMDYIKNIKSDIVSYIDSNKSKKRNSLDSIVAIIITSLTTISITSYNIRISSKIQDEATILEMLNIDFSIIIFLIMCIYATSGIMREIPLIKMKYYLKVNTIIDQIEEEEVNKYKKDGNKLRRRY